MLGLVMVAALVPLAVWAAASAQQDYLDAVRLVPDPERGAQLFGGCAACHGADGGGSIDGRIPRLAGQHAQVLIRQLIAYRYDQRRDPRMEPVAHRQALQGAQSLADVAGFAAALRARAPAGTGMGTSLEAGQRIFAARCGSCHGPAGRGRGDADVPVPRLAGQHYAYLLRQFHDLLEGRRPELSGSHGALLKNLDRDELQGLADTLSRAGGPG
jgi:cytochrome c553